MSSEMDHPKFPVHALKSYSPIIKFQANNLHSLKIKNAVSLTPLSCALNILH